MGATFLSFRVCGQRAGCLSKAAQRDCPQSATNSWFKLSHVNIDTDFCWLISIDISYRPSDLSRIGPTNFWEPAGNVLWGLKTSFCRLYVTVCWYHSLSSGTSPTTPLPLSTTHPTPTDICAQYCLPQVFLRQVSQRCQTLFCPEAPMLDCQASVLLLLALPSPSIVLKL